jgi:hypothetical protein
MDRAHDVDISFSPASGSSVGALDLRRRERGRRAKLTVAVRVCCFSLYKTYLLAWGFIFRCWVHALKMWVRMDHPTADAMLVAQDG